MKSSMDLGGPNTITSYIIIAAYEYFLLPVEDQTIWYGCWDYGFIGLFFVIYWLLIPSTCVSNLVKKKMCVAHEKTVGGDSLIPCD